MRSISSCDGNLMKHAAPNTTQHTRTEYDGRCQHLQKQQKHHQPPHKLLQHDTYCFPCWLTHSSNSYDWCVSLQDELEEGRHLDKVTLASTTAQSYTLSQRQLLNPISLNLKRPIIHTSCQVNMSQESKCPIIGVCRCNG